MYFTKHSPQYFQYPLGTVLTYCNIPDYIPYAVLYIPMTTLCFLIPTSPAPPAPDMDRNSFRDWLVQLQGLASPKSAGEASRLDTQARFLL